MTTKEVLKEEIKKELRDEAKNPFVPYWIRTLAWVFLSILMFLIIAWAMRQVFPAMGLSQKIFSVQPTAVVAPATEPIEQPAIAPAQPAINSQQPLPEDPVTKTSPDSEEILVTFGDLGTYRAVYDTSRKQWTIGQWPENLVTAGKTNLAQLKRDGGTVKFTMPSDGWLNNSAGELFVDGFRWNLGNYAELGRMTQETLILKGQEVLISYGPGNESAGFQIWLK